jgi:IS5 family transposase
VYADSAYKSLKHDEWLEEHGINNRVMERAYRNTTLTKAQKTEGAPQRRRSLQCGAGIWCI